MSTLKIAVNLDPDPPEFHEADTYFGLLKAIRAAVRWDFNQRNDHDYMIWALELVTGKSVTLPDDPEDAARMFIHTMISHQRITPIDGIEV